jgi:predicted ATPase
MMLTNIHLSHFKCFDQLSLPLAPLTLLTGFNAAGKSSALQAVLLLSQALRGEPHSRWISLRGPMVNLGTYGELVNAGREIALGVESNRTSLLWRLSPDDQSSTRAMLTSVEENYDRADAIVHPIEGRIDHLLPFTPSAATAALLASVRSTIFLSAVRAGTDVVFPSPDSGDPIRADVGALGQYAAWWFAQCLDEDIARERQHRKEPGSTLRRQVDAWAGDLFPGAEANASTLGRTGLVELQLRTKITEDWRRPANIGYGLTYAFPIIIAALLADRDQVLIIDSPEAHLHPHAQSLMGRFLAVMAAAGVRMILETHSDHLLNGIRIAVKDGLIAPDQAAIHFFVGANNGEKGLTQVMTAQLDAKGGLSRWPEGFFDQAEKDLAYLAGWTS